MKAYILGGEAVRVTEDVAEARAAVTAGTPIWIELEAQSPELDALLTDTLKLHALTIEDVWAARGEPKIEDFEAYLYLIAQGMRCDAKGKVTLSEVDILVGPTWIVTHDPARVVVPGVADQLARSPRLLQRGVAWIAHDLLDRVIDAFVPLIDDLDARVDKLGDDVLADAGTPRGPAVMQRVLSFKRTLQDLRRMSMHQREVLLRLSRGEFPLIPADALPFFRDVYDHFLRIHDVVDGYRDLVSSALEVYLSAQSNRLNEVMKTLTILSTVFMPVTFIAGIYGMNFANMPELKWQYGYPLALGLMALTTVGILAWFWKRGWIGKRSRG